MNVSPSTQKVVMSVILLAIVAYVGFTTIFGESEVSGEDVVLPPSVGQDILILADKLNSIVINKEVFSSPLFTSLVDTSSVVIEEPSGRPNPFLPIGNDAGSAPVVER